VRVVSILTDTKAHSNTRDSRFVGFPQFFLLMCALTSTSIGLDTCLAIQQTLYEGTRDSKYRPSVLLERMVDAQWYGRKNGKGFYEYTD
jgi:3-hydroxyacyl-CoA dehydrogenase